MYIAYEDKTRMAFSMYLENTELFPEDYPEEYYEIASEEAIKKYLTNIGLNPSEVTYSNYKKDQKYTVNYAGFREKNNQNEVFDYIVAFILNNQSKKYYFATMAENINSKYSYEEDFKESISYTTAEKQSVKEQSNSSASNIGSNYSLQDYALELEDMFTNSGFDHVDISVEDNVITIKVSMDGLAYDILKAKNGDTRIANEWKNIKEQSISTSVDMVKTAKNRGFEDVVILYKIQNEQNIENLFLSIMNGIVIYDVLDE